MFSWEAETMTFGNTFSRYCHPFVPPSLTLFILGSVLCCCDSQWTCSISLHFRITISWLYFLAYGFHEHWILLFILLSKRFGRRKRTKLYPCFDSKLRKNRQRFLHVKERFYSALQFNFLSLKNRTKWKLIKRGGGEGKHHYPSIVVWKRPWEDHFPLWGLLLVAFLCSWGISLPAPPILSFPITVAPSEVKLLATSLQYIAFFNWPET